MGKATGDGRKRSARTRDARASTSDGSAGARRDTGAAAPRRPSRAAITGLALLGLVVAGAGAAAYRVRSRGAQADFRTIPRQNVLLITIDTLRADALGSYGGPAATPNLDRLARQGVRYDFAHAHAVVTLPSHASILTGRYPFEHGVHDNSGYRLAAGTQTIATLLKASGYHTAAFIGGFPLNARFGLTRGFDVYDDRMGESHGPIEFALPERRADVVIAAAQAWIRAQPDQWFAWVHLFDAHAPYAPPAPFDRQYGDRPYYGEVAYVDHALKPLLDEVQTETRPTFIVVTADHGEALGDHGEATHGLFAYESTLRVPLILAQHIPGKAAREREEASQVPVRHVDLLPTILSAVGVAGPTGLPGRTLLPGSNTESDAASTSYFEAMSASLNRGWAPLQGVLAGREKFISLPIAELYNLSSDRGETTNLADREPQHRRVMEARLNGWHASAGGRRAVEDPETVARLRSLGYAAGGNTKKDRYTEDDDPKRLIDVDSAIHRGIGLFEQGHPAEAIDTYRQILARRPDLAVAVSHLAFLYWSQGDTQSAVGTLQRALSAGVVQSGIPSQLGVYLAETGSAKAALPLLQTATADQSDLDALNALGIAYGHLGQAARALESFRAILQIDPQNAPAYQNIASIEVQRGHIAAAREALDHALAIDPRSARAHTGLGVVQLREGQRGAAIESWRRAVALDPSDYDARFNLANELVNDRQLVAARPYLERFVRSAPAAQYGRDIRRFEALLAGR